MSNEIVLHRTLFQFFKTTLVQKNTTFVTHFKFVKSPKISTDLVKTHCSSKLDVGFRKNM